MSRYVSANLLADNAEFDRAWERSALVADETAGKIAKSARQAAASAAAQAKAAGASASEQEAAAARAAVSYTSAAEKITKAQQAAGKAAMDAAKAAGASADEQVAAWKRAVAATGGYEAAQRRTAAAAEESAARITAAHKKIASLGKWTIAGGLGAGFFAVKGAAELQKQMEMLHTQAGATQQQVNGLTKSVTGMAGAVGTGPKDLADGLFHVVSSLNKTLPAATRSATEMKVLRIAAEGAKVGNANLVDVTNALDAAIVSGVKGVHNYSQTMGVMNATVGAGDMTMQQLADAFGTGLLAKAKTAGLSIKDVGAAAAVMGDNNIRGAEAGTLLGSAFRIMSDPSKAASKALAAVGLSADQLGTTMRSRGLIPALAQLKAHLEASGATAQEQSLIITRAFGGRQSTGVQVLLGQLDRLKASEQQVGEGGKKFGSDWAATQKTASFEFDQLKASIQATADKVGLALIPKLQALVGTISNVVSWLGKHKAAAEALAITIGTVLGAAVAVFVGTRVVAFVHGLQAMIGGMAKLASGIADGAAAIEAKLTGVSSASSLTAGKVAGSNAAMEASNAEAGASFTALDTEAGAAATGVESKAGAMAAAVTTADGEIEGANAAAAGSFAAISSAAGSLLAKLGPLAIAYAGFQATKATGLFSSGTWGSFGKPSNSFPVPSAHETERSYIAQTLKLPGYNGPLTFAGVQHARTQQGYPAEKSLIEQFFTQMNSEGHFGHHGFVATPGGAYGPGPDAIRQKLGVHDQQMPGASTPAQIANYLHAQGLSNVAIAGILGNFAQETGGGTISGINTRDSGTGASGMGGMGIAQWTQGRRLQEMAYAKSQGLAPTALAAQLGYLKQELGGGYSSTVSALQGASNPAQAALLFNSKFEGGTDPSGIRERAAQAAYAWLQKGMKGYTTVSNPAGSTSTPSASTPSAALQNYLNGASGTSTTTGPKATMRYFGHQPVGVMTEPQWQAWQAQNSGKLKATAVANAIFAATDKLHQTYAKTGESLDQRYGNVTQSGTSRTLASALGLRMSGPATLSMSEMGGYREGGLGVPSLSRFIHDQIESMGTHPTGRDISGRLGGALRSATGSSPQGQAYNAAVQNLIQTGQTKEADKLVAAHKAAMAALASTLYAEQKTRDGQQLAQQATALKDQTTAIQNAMQSAQTVWQASEQKINDMASATVQSMQDMQQTVNDQMAGMAQATRDATQLSSAQSAGIVTAIQDQTQTQVDQIGEKGLYGMNLVVQQLQVQADITKAGYDQQISQATQAFDVLQMQANQQETIARLSLDQVIEQQHAAVAAAQQNLNTVTITQDGRIASAQAHADAVQLHADASLIGPAQIAVDLNANASKSDQAKFQAQLTAATGLGDKQVAGATQALANVQSAAQAAINAAQGTYDTANNTANQMIQGAQENLDNLTNNFNNLLATAQGNLQTLTDTAGQVEATQQGGIAVTGAQASTQFAGSGLHVEIYGADLSNPAGLTDAVSWAIRSSGLATP